MFQMAWMPPGFILPDDLDFEPAACTPLPMTAAKLPRTSYRVMGPGSQVVLRRSRRVTSRQRPRWLPMR